MTTEQIQQLMPEGELIRVAFDNASYWTIYEGVVDGEDSFVKQHYSRGYPTRMLNSLRCKRDRLQFDSENRTVTLNHFRLVRYDINHPNNPRLARTLENQGIWERFNWR